MADRPTTQVVHDEPWYYQIRLQGLLDAEWTTWFDGLTVTHTANGDTLLTGPVVDQAALHGLLRKVRDLGLPLLACICLATDTATMPERKAADDNQRDDD